MSAGITADQRLRIQKWPLLLGPRKSVLKSLETAREEKRIGSSLEARVTLAADKELYPLLQEYARELPGLFIVSQVDLRNHASEGVEVSVERASGIKCERCWKYTEDVGVAPELPTVCGACAAAVREILEDAELTVSWRQAGATTAWAWCAAGILRWHVRSIGCRTLGRLA